MSVERKPSFNRRMALRAGAATLASIASTSLNEVIQEGGPQKAEAQSDPLPQGEILFISNESGKPALYISSLTGENPRKLVSIPEGGYMPILTSDGRHLVYVVNRHTRAGTIANIFSLELESGRVKSLTNDQELGGFLALSGLKSKILFRGRVLDPTEPKSYYLLKEQADQVEVVRRNFQKIEGPKTLKLEDGVYFLYTYTTAEGEKLPLIAYPVGRVFWFSVPKLSPDGEWMAFGTEEVDYRTGDVYKIRPDGQAATKLTDNLWGTTVNAWSPDGKWILFTDQEGPTGDSDLYIIPSAGGKPRKLFDTPHNTFGVQWRPAPTQQNAPQPEARSEDAPGEEPETLLQGRTSILFIPGLTSIVEGTGGGIESSGKFSELTTQAREQGFKGQDFSTMSWGGMTVDKKTGLSFAKPSTCEGTLKSAYERGKMIRLHTLDKLAVRPNDKIDFMSDSDGYMALVSFMEMTIGDIEKDANFPIKPENMSFIFVHPPALGVDKPGLSALTMIFTQGCKLGPAPSPSVFTSPAGVNLLSSWENKEKTEERIKRVVSWWRERGARVAAVGNKDDLVISIRRAVLSNVAELLPGEQEWLVESFPNQEVPGAENYLLELGIGGKMLGHDRVWKTVEGRRLLLKLIGSQIKEEPKPSVVRPPPAPSKEQLAALKRKAIAELPFTHEVPNAWRPGFTIEYFPKTDWFLVLISLPPYEKYEELAKKWFTDRGLDPEKLNIGWHSTRGIAPSR